MAKKNNKETKNKTNIPKAYIESAGIVVNEKITETLEKNYMPYAMSVIVSRALPEIDGFKPSHRKLLYTMYKMGLLTGSRTKSANVVGQTMRLNPHGDGAIYETLVRLSRGNGTLLHSYIDSKGNFGKSYSRDMAYAASRYTEVKLDAICNELFKDIDKNTVDFIPNYDNSTTEPTLLPSSFPSVLINSNVGIAVSMASTVCPFNLAEVCETCIALIKNPNHDILSTLKSPDFPTGGFILYDEDETKKIYETGRGSIKIRSKYNYDATANCIEVTEIPYGTTIEAIIDKIIDLIKNGKIREISYLRDETDLSGLKIAIDLKRGIDPDKLMQKLYKMTPLQDNYSCNFNILINGNPRVMGVREILTEWTKFREDCVRRRVIFELNKKSEKLHLLKALQKILLDIDKAIKIVRETEEENEVVSNLMIGFGIDTIQAEYVAEIKLRHLNREYILNRTKEISELENQINEMQETLEDRKKILKIIIDELKNVIKKYQKPRQSVLLYPEEVEEYIEEDETPDYNATIFLSNSGYFKKIIPQSLRMNSEQKLKEGDYITTQIEISNKYDIIFFSDKYQVYKTKASAFDDLKSSVLGDYIPAKLEFDENEFVFSMFATKDYSGYLLFIYENGKIAKIPLSSYQTKTNRKKLTNAYSDKFPLIKIIFIEEDCDILIRSSNGRALIFNTELINPKTTRDSIGVQVLNLKAKATVESAQTDISDIEPDLYNKFKVKTLPASGSISKSLPPSNQLSLL